MSKTNYSVLFVCLGNICRSATAEGVFRKLSTELIPEIPLVIESAGTSGYHAGENADSRMIRTAKQHEYDLSKIISRQVKPDDFDRFDLILAMDNENQSNLEKLAIKHRKNDAIDNIRLFLDFSQQNEHTQVPDPYYGGSEGFELVIELIEDASRGLVDYIRNLESNA